MTNARKAKHGWLLTTIFSILSVVYVLPIFIVLINSFKRKAYISREPFKLPTEETWVAIENYVRGIDKIKFIDYYLNVLFMNNYLSFDIIFIT